MLVRLRALVAGLLSVAMLAELPASAAAVRPPVHSPTGTHVTAGVSAVPPTRIPVKEPTRVRPIIRPADMRRVNVVRGVRPSTGVRVSGPPMLRPAELDRVLAAARTRGALSRITQPVLNAAHPIPPPKAGVAAPHARTAHSLPSNSTASGTGINHWWRYQEETVPGGGHVMVNVGTGNMLLQEDDMAIPHKGIALTFRRTYNSQSLHNVNAGDAAGFLWSPPGMYGNGWTNTFDAHIARAPDGTFWTVFDVDGTRYDYAHVPGSLTWTPPPGEHATLTSAPNCGVVWTKKNGTKYYFYNPNASASCPALTQQNTSSTTSTTTVTSNAAVVTIGVGTGHPHLRSAHRNL